MCWVIFIPVCSITGGPTNFQHMGHIAASDIHNIAPTVHGTHTKHSGLVDFSIMLEKQEGPGNLLLSPPAQSNARRRSSAVSDEEATLV